MWQNRFRVPIVDGPPRRRSAAPAGQRCRLRAGLGVLTESLQTLGGSGFLQDYPIEQYIRDARIDSLYEGTTAIQSMDFFFRKVVRDRGEALAHLAAQITHTIDACDARLKPQALLLSTALVDVQAMLAAVTGYLMAASERPKEIYKVGLVSVQLLLAVGDLLIGWRLLEQARVAQAAMEADPDRRRYQVLRGQGRDRDVLRRQHAAADHRGARDRRGGRPRSDGVARGCVLEPAALTSLVSGPDTDNAASHDALVCIGDRPMPHSSTPPRMCSGTKSITTQHPNRYGSRCSPTSR